MTIRLLILALSLPFLGQQEPEIREWIKELQDPDPTAALRARDRLVHHGGRKALELMGEAHPGIRAEIELNRSLGKRYAAAPNITLKAKDEIITNVFAQLESQSGEQFNFSNADTSKVISIDIENLPFWTALHRICQAGEVQISNSIQELISIRTGKPSDQPRCEYGPFQILLTSVKIDRIARKKSHERRMALTFYVNWISKATPQGVIGLPKIDSITDSKGRSLLPGHRPSAPPKTTTGYYRRGVRYATAHIPDLFAPPEQDLTIAEIRGSVQVSFATHVTEVKFTNPVEAIADTFKGKGFTVEMKSCTMQRYNGVISEMAIIYDEGQEASVMAPGAIDVDFFTQNDQSFPAYLYNVKREKNRMTFTARCYNIRNVEIDRIRLKVPQKSVVKPVPFVFRNVKLK